MKTWLVDLWQGFFTVLVGMKITWRHLFVQKATLHYPEERW
jgi:formate hydrogenlyase subunit 6/NADH:ubiquinone oxidoreductase subunit I